MFNECDEPTVKTLVFSTFPWKNANAKEITSTIL